nr:MAG TPA: hypothetical protein [Caudoviricetes sp.]
MTVKIALKKKFNKNAAACFIPSTRRASPARPSRPPKSWRWALTKPTRTTSTSLSRTRTEAKARSATATLTFLSSEQEGAT